MKPLRYSTHHVTEDDIAAVTAVLRSDWLTQGPAVEAFEAALCEYTGAKYAVAVNSGTAALYLAYRAARLPPDSDVLMTPFTFVATVNALLLACSDVLGRNEDGGGLLFGDVYQGTGLLDDDDHRDSHSAPCGYCGAALVVPVHYAGRAARLPRKKDRVLVIEDAAHALGAMDFDGCSRVGSCAHSLATCFSFHPVKPITCGEGGAVTTNDQGFADEVRALRSHGRDSDGLVRSLSGNYRMPDINAALGLSQLKRVDEMQEVRCELACTYLALLPPDDERMTSHGILTADDDAVSCPVSHHLYPVRIKNGRRDEVKAKLNAQGIGAQVHYNPPVHLQPYYRERFGYKPGDFPEAEAWSEEELSLPLHSQMTEADVERVVDALGEALA